MSKPEKSEAGCIQTQAGARLQESETTFLERAAAGEGAGKARREEIPRFELLEITPEERKRRRASFGVGSIAQVMVVALVLWFLTAPPYEEPKSLSHVWSQRITLEAPPPLSAALRRPRVVRIPPPPHLKQQAELPKANPKPVARPPVPPVTARLQPIPVPKPPPVPIPAAPPKIATPKPTTPKRELQMHVGAFSNSSPAVATTRLPRARVQTGGFGDPNGLTGEAEGGSHGNIPHLGSFDRPEGPGSGNGTGGAHGARALVASAGFGNSYATGSSGREAEGPIRSAGFADARSLTHAPPQAKLQPAVAAFTAVEITSKPDPVYTAEALRLHIQGEVLLRVVFAASGEIRILGVKRGLGHGLDQAAIRAAQQIRYKPARRNGQPVDTPAILHILFQLAE